jgi:hypothetical protein
MFECQFEKRHFQYHLQSQKFGVVKVQRPQLYIIIILYYVSKLNSCQSSFGGRLGQIQKNEIYSRDFFFSANIIQQVVDFWFWNRLYVF